MANPCMICLFVPVADAAAAGRIETLIGQIDASLRKELGAVPCLHFAALALLPPRPGEQQGLPSLMFEWTIDAGVERGELAAALVTHAASSITQLLNAANPNGAWATGTSLHDYLKENFDLAAGGFVGVRDRKRQQIVADDANFVLARAAFNRPGVVPANADRAGIVDALIGALKPVPGAWNPRPRSIWRKPWMKRPVQAASIAALLVLSPVTALGFGWPAVLLGIILSSLVLTAAAVGAAILLPALAVGALAAISAVAGFVLALVSLPPYTGVLSALAWAAALGLALGAAFLSVTGSLARSATCLSWSALIAISGLVLQWINHGATRSAAAVAAYLRHGTYDLSRIASRGTTQANRMEWLPLMLILLAAALLAVALAWSAAAPLILMGVAGLVLIWLAAHQSVRWIAIALVLLWVVGAVIVGFDAAAPAALTHLMAPLLAWSPQIAAIGQIAAVAALALVFTALVGLAVFLFSRVFARVPLIAGGLACIALALIAWWALPGAGAGDPLSNPAATLRLHWFGIVLLLPILLFAALASAHYRQGSKAMAAALMAWLVATGAGVCLVSPTGLTLLSPAPALHWILLECVVLAAAFLLHAALVPARRQLLMTALGLIILHGIVLAGAAQAANGPWSRWVLVAVLAGALIVAAALALRAATLVWRGPAGIADLAVLAGSSAALLLAAAAIALCLPPAMLPPLARLTEALAGVFSGVVSGVLTAAWTHWITAIALALLAAALLAATVLAARHYGAAVLTATVALLAAAAALGVGTSAVMAAWSLFGDTGTQGSAPAALAFAPLFSSPFSSLSGSIVAAFPASMPSRLLVAALLLAAPFAALALAAAGFIMMQAAGALIDAAGQPVHAYLKRSRQIHPSIRACEAKLAYRMQHMISVTEVRRPLWLFAPLLRYVLWAINSIGMIWCTEGSLGTAPGIHFGHWHVMDQGRRLVFASNFEVPFGGYLDDFILGTPGGINLIWQCTELPLRNAAAAGHPAVSYARRFPPTPLAYFGGCRNEQWFKSYARDSMVPHLFRYEAYNVTYADIERATHLREAISRVQNVAASAPGTRDHVADDQILRALES